MSTRTNVLKVCFALSVYELHGYFSEIAIPHSTLRFIRTRLGRGCRDGLTDGRRLNMRTEAERADGS